MTDVHFIADTYCHWDRYWTSRLSGSVISQKKLANSPKTLCGMYVLYVGCEQELEAAGLSVPYIAARECRFFDEDEMYEKEGWSTASYKPKTTCPACCLLAMELNLTDHLEVKEQR